MLYLDPPFNMLISGITNCGKTHFVLDLIEKEYLHKFDFIIIICPTYMENKTYCRKFIYCDNDVIPLSVEENLNHILRVIIEKYKDTNEQTLIVIDDCANLHDAKLKATALTELAFHGRHKNLSTWVITQKYNAIVKDFRANIGMLVMFYDKDRESREDAFKENDIGISADEKASILKILKNNKNSKLVMRLFQPFDYGVFS